MRKDSTLCSSFNSKDFSDREQVHRKLDFTIFLLWDHMGQLTLDPFCLYSLPYFNCHHLQENPV